MKLFLCKTILLTVLMLSLLYMLDDQFLYRKNGTIGLLNSFENAEDNSVDVLFVGNSHMALGVDLNIIEAKTGLRAEMIAAPGLEIALVYYNLLEALKTQSPSVVVLETYPLIMRNSINDPVHADVLLQILGPKALLKYKAHNYKNFALEIRGGDLYDRFYTFKYHDDWIDKRDFFNVGNNELESYSRDDNRRVQRARRVQIPKYRIDNFLKKDFAYQDMFLTSQEKRFLKKIFDLSKAKKFRLVFTKVPVLDLYYEQTKIGFDRVEKEIIDLAEGYENVFYFDVNKHFRGLDHTHIRDEWGITHSQHLNYKGIIKTSVFISEYLNKQFKFPKKKQRVNSSIEAMVYNDNVFNSHEFTSIVTKINDVYGASLKEIDTVKISKNEKWVDIRGWMHCEDLNMDEAEKKIVLKKDADFVYVSDTEIRTQNYKWLVKKYGKSHENSGFVFKVNKNYLDPGVYQIICILHEKDNTILKKELNKWIYIE